MEEKLRSELRTSFKNRAFLYYLIFDELRGEVGPQKAEEILRRAIYRRGEQMGEPLRKFAPDDLKGLNSAFLAMIPDEGRMFRPNVQRSDEEVLEIHLEACPLKEAWEELGLGEQDRVTMCRIAGEVDRGMFEAAGFSFEPDTWQPGRSGCCHLHIRANS